MPRTLHSICVFAVLLSGGWLFGCGEEVPEYNLVRLPSGLEIRVQAVGVDTTNDGRQVVLLRYLTDLDLEDTESLRLEIQQIWPYIRPLAEGSKLDLAVVQPNTEHREGWQVRGNSYQIAFKKTGDSWSAIEGADIDFE